MAFLTSWFKSEHPQAIENPSVLAFDLKGSQFVVHSPEKESIWTFDFDDEHLTVSGPSQDLIAQIALKSLRRQTKSFEKLSKTISCLRDSQNAPPHGESVGTLPPLPASENPYDAPFWSHESIAQNSWLKAYYFIHGEILGSRGQMALKKAVQLPCGDTVNCCRQMMTDAGRWGNADFTINDSHKPLPEEGLKAGGKVSQGLLQLMEEIYALYQQNKTLFERFSTYFHQGPFNEAHRANEYLT